MSLQQLLQAMQPLAQEQSPFILNMPNGWTTRVTVDSSHDGLLVPPSFTGWSTATDEERWRFLIPSDTWVGEIARLASRRAAAALLEFQVARSLVDANREPDDILPETVNGGSLGFALNPLPLTGQRKVGLIHHVCDKNGADLYPAGITVEDALARINDLYKPYVAQQGQIIATARQMHERVCHFSIHSCSRKGTMNMAGGDQVRPDVCLGNRHGQTAPNGLLDVLADVVRSYGFNVQLNDPFPGDALIRRYCDLAAGVLGIQVEFAKNLYMDEDSLVPDWNALSLLGAVLGHIFIATDTYLVAMAA